MKEYVKPELFYEDFELSQHIAGCSLKLESADPMTCDASGYIDGDYLEGGDNNKGWFVSLSVCSVEVEGYCYTNSTMSLATINS